MLEAVDNTATAITWGPYILAALVLLAGAIGFFFRSILKSLGDLAANLAVATTNIAVMKEHINGNDADIREITKYHDEIMEHKVALAELNVKVNSIYNPESTFNKSMEH